MKKLLERKFSIFSFTISGNDVLSNPLLSGTTIMVFGTNLANFFAYIYHVIFGRIFDPSQYGDLAATLSIIGLISSALTFFSIVIVKFASAAENKKEKQKLLVWFFSRGVMLGSLISLLFLFSTPYLSNFLHINKNLMFLVGPIFLLSLISLIFKSFLQGILKFKEMVIVTNVEMIGRLLFGLLFVYLGFSVFGTIAGLLVSALVGVICGKYYLNSYPLFGVKERHIDAKKVISYSLPILLSSVASNALLSMDLVLVKHFFSGVDAGIYASVGTVGKIIFYGTAPVAAVMFPIVSQKHAKGENYIKVFILSLLLTVCISLGVLFLFLFFPSVIINSIYGVNRYVEAGQYLFIYGVFIMLFTLASLVLSFYLSIGKIKLIGIAVVGALLQIVGIWFFHNSLFSVIEVSIVSSLFFLVCLLVYFAYETRKKST